MQWPGRDHGLQNYDHAGPTCQGYVATAMRACGGQRKPDCCNTAPKRARYIVIAVVLLLALGLAAAGGAFREPAPGQLPEGTATTR